jgi:hypothetical protein
VQRTRDRDKKARLRCARRATTRLARCGLSSLLLSLACSLQMPSETEVFGGPGGTDAGSGGLAADGSAKPNASEAGTAGSTPTGGGGGGGGGGSVAGSTSTAQAGTSSGLVAHFAFEDSASTAENAIDASQSGTYHGTWTKPDGVRGKAVGLRNAGDTNGDWVELPAGILSQRSEATLSVWTRVLSTSRSGARLFAFVRGSSELFYFSPDDMAGSNGPGAHLYGSHASTSFVDLWTKTPLTDKQWHHVAVRWSATKIELYIDGSSVGSADPGGVKPSDLGVTTPNLLARGADDNLVGLYGEIDELELFARSLKSSEIAAIYAAR